MRCRHGGERCARIVVGTIDWALAGSVITVRVLGRGEAGRVGGDVLNGVGRDLGRVDRDVADERAVEEVFEAEVLVGVRPKLGDVI